MKTNTITEQNQGVTHASHVLQFIFLLSDGFRLPFAFYPTAGVNASDLFNLFWEAVSKLTVLGFEIDYLCMDGPSANRSFIKLNNSTYFQTKHFYSRDSKITFAMYYSHVIKMIRNNISSSGHGDGHTRLLSY